MVWGKAHEKGILQLSGYLDSLGLDKGYLIIYDTRHDGKKEWKQVSAVIDGKEIYMVGLGHDTSLTRRQICIWHTCRMTPLFRKKV